VPERGKGRKGPEGSGRNEALALGAALITIFGCCGMPLLVALASSLALGALLGIFGAIVAAVALVAGALAWSRRRRRECALKGERSSAALGLGRGQEDPADGERVGGALGSAGRPRERHSAQTGR
jgi:hypothetical protein